MLSPLLTCPAGAFACGTFAPLPIASRSATDGIAVGDVAWGTIAPVPMFKTCVPVGGDPNEANSAAAWLGTVVTRLAAPFTALVKPLSISSNNPCTCIFALSANCKTSSAPSLREASSQILRFPLSPKAASFFRRYAFSQAHAETCPASCRWPKTR